MPPALLEATGLCHRHGGRLLFDDVAVRVDATSRIALIGSNGSGKSTLLDLLAGARIPQAGAVHHHATVAHIPQIADAPGAGTVGEALLQHTGVAAASLALETAEAALANGDAPAIAAHADALQRWLAAGGADADVRLRTCLAQVGLDDIDPARRLDTLSGGELARTGLAAALAARADVLLLDEPSNHLDADGRRTLLDLLASRTGGVLVATHDRDLLEAVADEVIAIDAHAGAVTHHAGGWAAVRREREAARRAAQAAHDQAVRRRAALRAAERETRERAATSHRRAGRHDPDKHMREWVRSRADGMARRARIVAERTARIDVPDRPWTEPPTVLRLPAAALPADWALVLDRAVLHRGPHRIGPVHIALRRGERLLLLGPNGSGKSTVIAALAGRLEPASGRAIRPAAHTVAELGQLQRRLRADISPAANLRHLSGVDETAARTALASFGIGADIAANPLGTASAGERLRVELAAIAARGAGCLLLDEPTNHLDLAGVEALEEALDGWDGALVIATHDPHLRRALAAHEVLDLGAPGRALRARSRAPG